MTKTRHPGPPTKREKLAWCLFDFANSSFTTVIVTVVYARYFVAVVVGESGYGGLKADVWWSIGNIASQLVVLVAAPIVGALADQRACKKRFLAISYGVCVLATALLTFSAPGWVIPALLIFGVANIAFSMGENLVAGFLPELASQDEMGRLSAYGWTVGYFGGLAALFLALPLATNNLPEWTCLATAVFFALAGLPTLLWLRERAVPSMKAHREGLMGAAFGELRSTWRQRHRYRDLFTFLFCILMFQAGVYIVVAYAGIYAQEEIGMTSSETIQLFIALQITAAAGAFAFGYIQDSVGSRPALALSILLWLIAVCLAWSATGGPAFVAAGLVAGAAMGSSQTSSRALVGLFCPHGREAEWFGLWGVAVKASAVLGLLYYSAIVSLSDRRTAIISTALLFVAGLIVLRWVDVQRGRDAALRESSSDPRSL